MWKKFKNFAKERWDRITFRKLKVYGVIIGTIGISSIFVTRFILSKELYIIGILLIYFCMILLYKAHEKKQKEKKEEQKNQEEEQEKILKAEMKKILKEKNKKIEVKFKKDNNSPYYYTKKSYKDLGNLIFLHMLVFLQEKIEFKCYAELCKEEILILYIDTEDGIKQYPQFPYELFIEYFEPVK